jgi:hypothetical protein
MSSFNFNPSGQAWEAVRVKRPTYRAASLNPFVAAVTADVPWFLIEGSATKLLTIKRIVVTGPTLTAVEYLAINVEKYSTAASGGTATTAPQVPLDSALAAGSASLVKYYTVAPTPGTLVGTIASRRVLGQATVAAAAGLLAQAVFDFSDIPETHGIVLRGVGQGAGLVWATAPATAVTLTVEVEWTEE